VLDDSANPETKDDYSAKIAAALDAINDPGLKALIMETPFLEGVITDTSTSDLRIRPFALPMMQGMLEILCTCSSEKRDNKLKAAQQHVDLMHNPLIALQSSGQIMKFAALGSGAYLHEVSTAMATLVTTLTCMKFVKSTDFSELLAKVSELLPQGLKTHLVDGVEHVTSLPEGSSTDCLMLGGSKYLGLTHEPWLELEAAALVLPRVASSPTWSTNSMTEQSHARCLFAFFCLRCQSLC